MKKLSIIIFCIFIHTKSFSQEEFCKKSKKSEQIDCLTKNFFKFKNSTHLKISNLEKKLAEQQKKLDLLNDINIKNDIEVLEINPSRTVLYSTQESFKKNSENIANDKNYLPQVISFNSKDEISSITINNAIFIQAQKKVQVFLNFTVTTTGFNKNPYIEFLITIPHNQNKFKNKHDIIGVGSSEIIDWLQGESSFTVTAEPNTAFAKIQGKIHTNYSNTSSNSVTFAYALN